MKLGDFDGGRALVQSHFRVRQAGRNHGYGAVVTEPEKSAGGQENLRFTNLSIERLTRLQFRRTYRLTVEGLPCDGGLPFHIIYTSRACWVCTKSRPRHSRNQDEALNSFQHCLPHNFHPPTNYIRVPY